jgi:tRNA U55 pseudouridine synthase TruB
LFSGLIYGNDKQYYFYARAAKVVEHEKNAIEKYSLEVLEEQEKKHSLGFYFF